MHNWLIRNAEALEALKRLAARYVPRFPPGAILAMNQDPVVEQEAFAWGDPGTETGHTLDTQNANRTVELDGTGNYLAFLRILLADNVTNADQNLTRTYKLRYQRNGTGGYTDVTAASSFVRVIADSNITDGAATTNRLTSVYGTASAGEYDEGDGAFDSVTWNATSTEYRDFLISLEIVDADMAAGDFLDFRIYETDNTALAGGYTQTPRLTWNAPAAAENIATLTMPPMRPT